jgi:hypothetical protein
LNWKGNNIFFDQPTCYLLDASTTSVLSKAEIKFGHPIPHIATNVSPKIKYTGVLSPTLQKKTKKKTKEEQHKKHNNDNN